VAPPLSEPVAMLDPELDEEVVEKVVG